MWYVVLNGKRIPVPYRTYDECMAECRRFQETMCAVAVHPELVND